MSPLDLPVGAGFSLQHGGWHHLDQAISLLPLQILHGKMFSVSKGSEFTLDQAVARKWVGAAPGSLSSVLPLI